MEVADFSHSYFRFFLDFAQSQPVSISTKPPVQANRVRVSLESICRLKNRSTGNSTTYALSAPCRTERVGAGRNELWIQPNAECIFLCSDDGQSGIHKCWHKKDPGVMLYPPSLGPQPERQTFAAGENFQEVGLDLQTVAASPLVDFDQVTAAIHGTQAIVSRIEYRDGDFDVCIEQPVKTINLAERDRLHQTDTGPIILPDLSAERLAQAKLEIDVFDLAYSAWHQPDWAEFVIQASLRISAKTSVNHFAKTRHVSPTQNTLLVVEAG